MHYSDYLQTDKILNAQFPESAALDRPAHDEMLFIIVHQVYELWFKQLLYEVSSVNDIMLKPALNDNSPELQTVVHRLSRCITVLKTLVQQIDIMETMNPMDFLDFRDLLKPASGFQSIQFKMLEAILGLRYEDRHGQDYYLSQLREEERVAVREAEAATSLFELVNSWLERMPFFNEPENWKNFQSTVKDNGKPHTKTHPFWTEYAARYAAGLAPREMANLTIFNEVLFEGSNPSRLSPAASRAALFIMLYRGYPVLQLPFQLIDSLLAIDEQLSTWRYRHMNMVHRTIGSRIGTGGSTGRDYLAAALNKHFIFKELAQLTSFLLERKMLPSLSHEMETRLGFTS